MQDYIVAWSILLLRALYWIHAAFAHACAAVRPYLALSPCPPRPGNPTVSPQWLTTVLRERGLIGAKVDVATVEAKDLEGNHGMVGVMKRIHVAYSGPAGASAPTTLILKMSPGGFAGRRGVIASGQYREAMFYGSSLARSLPRGFFPETIYVYGSPVMGEYVILMEDLHNKDKETATGVGMVFGNQCWGVPAHVAEQPLPDPVAVLEKMFLSCAEIHAQHWRDPALLRAGWLKGAVWYSGKGRISWEAGMMRGRLAWAAAKRKYLGSSPSTTPTPSSVKFSPKLVRIMDESFARASWATMQAHLRNPTVPWTLCHGDFHAGNMILLLKSAASADGNNNNNNNHTNSMRLVMFDWSEVGPWEPTTDLAQTIISDVKPSVFLPHTRTLLHKYYWRRLIELGACTESEYPFEACWDAFCRGGAERWIWIFAVIASLPGVPDAMVQYFHDQLLAFIEGYGGNDRSYYELKPIVFMY